MNEPITYLLAQVRLLTPMNPSGYWSWQVVEEIHYADGSMLSRKLAGGFSSLTREDAEQTARDHAGRILTQVYDKWETVFSTKVRKPCPEA